VFTFSPYSTAKTALHVVIKEMLAHATILFETEVINYTFFLETKRTFDI
jgi:hypothetical protein